MFFRDDGGRYAELARVVDTIFSRCDDDPPCIAAELKSLDPDIRAEILSSDLLNAWQVFWYFFQTYPGDEVQEYLVFHSAGELVQGVPMGIKGIFTLTFMVVAGDPIIKIEDDIVEVARFAGLSAYRDTLNFIKTDG